MAITAASLAAKPRILSACVRLFLENGYTHNRFRNSESCQCLGQYLPLVPPGLSEQVMQELFRNLAMRFSFSLGNS